MNVKFVDCIQTRIKRQANDAVTVPIILRPQINAVPNYLQVAAIICK